MRPPHDALPPPALTDPDRRFGIYLHWPFCAARCPYCDFNVRVDSSVDQEAWRDGYLRALDRAALRVGGRVCSSIYFGGGTPSLMEPSLIEAIIEHIATHWQLPSAAEITLEANPSSSSRSRFAAFRHAGINRISIGVQSLRDADLAMLGRRHDAARARAAVQAAQAEFGNVSIDLIYGRQHQDIASWRHELRQAISLEPGHLSLYQLTIEANTPFGARLRANRLDGLPDDTRAVAFDTVTEALCQEAGFERYEVSNFAGSDGIGHHNMLYWQSLDYLGIGPGSHGRLTLEGTRIATNAIAQPAQWLDAVMAGSGAEVQERTLARREQATEYAMMSLRLTAGMEIERYARLNGAPVNPDRLAMLASEGLVRHQGETLRATPKGRLVLNALIAAILD